jgi:serine/threonine protein kinase
MKQCSLCAHTRADGNLWCQQPACPAENTVNRLRPGDFVGELEINKWVATLPSATVYRAKRANEMVLLKVAHPGFAEKLKREARFLISHSHPGLPQLLAAHSGTTVAEHPYGRITIYGQLFTYLLFADVEGRTLTLEEWLTRNPQPWQRDVGWIMSALTDTLAFYHYCALYHFGLSPGIILLRFDSQGIPRPVLLDLGLCAPFEDVGRYWQPQLVDPYYTAPELRLRQPLSQQTDLYGLGVILQVMLTGLNGKQSLSRSDLRELPQLAQWAMSVKMSERPLTCIEFANKLLSIIPPLPSEKKAKSIRKQFLQGLLMITMFVALLSLLFLLQ